MTPEWEKLTPYQQVRLRTEWVFGSRHPHTQTVLEYGPTPHMVETTWVPALFTCFREVLDNSLDEVVSHGHGNRIDVTYDPDELLFSVQDNGRGMPIEWSEKHQNYAATILLSEMMSGRNFGDRGESRGLNGIGAKGVNYCSEWFKAEISRGKQQFIQTFSEGEQLVIGGATIWPTNSKKTGTKISFKLSRKVFHDQRLPSSFIAARLTEIALCYPKLHLTFNGKPIQGKELQFPKKPIEFSVAADRFTSRFWLVPDFVADGEFSFSLVNAIPLFNGGTHIEAFRRHFYGGLLNGLERENRKRKLVPNRADISDGLLIYNITEMAEPTFDSQSKTRLINEPVGNLIRQSLDAPDFYKDIVRKNPEWIEAIYERCARRTQVKDAKDTIRQAKRNLRQKIEDLEDACGHDRSQCILALCEGKSAASGLVEARDPNIHGALPLRGKVLNTFGLSPKKALENESLAKIFNAIGLIPGQRANRHMLRYGKVYLTMDADEDGKSIVSLLVGVFYEYWPELFEPTKPAFLHVFETPLLIAVKGKNRKYWYNNDYHTFDPEKFKGWEIVRAKGLAALEREDWRYVLKNPKLVPIVDDGKLGDGLRLLFSADTDARKRWIGL